MPHHCGAVNSFGLYMLFIKTSQGASLPISPLAPALTETTGQWLPEFRGPFKFRQGALFWYDFGFAVIPIEPKSKKTAVKWDPWLANLAHASIRQYWTDHPDHEVGFILGDGHIVFDADSQAAVDFLIVLEGAYRLRPTMVVKTKRGAHHYFKKDQGLDCKTTAMNVGTLEDRIDIKTGRTMVLLPPSADKRLIQLGGRNAESAKDLTLAPETLLEELGAIRKDVATPNQPPRVVSHSYGVKTTRLIAASLDHLDPDCVYGDWFKVCCILSNLTDAGEDGYQLFDEWSSKGSKYRGRTDTRKKWKSVNANSPRRVGWPTLQRMVEDEGYCWLALCAMAEDPSTENFGWGPYAS